jgi:exopolysaccharide production protein ExoZ
MSKLPMSKLQTLQCGRALAAIGVVAFHLSATMTFARYGGVSPFLDDTRLGKLGVDFFFVLSGFIILLAHHGDLDRPGQWGYFAYRRFVRLFPVYWLYTAVYILLVKCGFGQNAHVPMGTADWLTTLTLVRFDGVETPLAPAWTLFHEIQFYAAFSLLILSRRLGMLALGLLAAVAFATCHVPAEDARSALSVYTSAYFLHFVLGMGAFLRYLQKDSGVVDVCAGVAILVVGGLTMPLPYALSNTLIATGFAFALAGAAKLEAHYGWSCPKLLRALGDASYSIYLTHVAAIGLVLKLASKSGLSAAVSPATVYFMVLGAALVLGTAAYHVVERPLLKWMQGRRWKVRPVLVSEM